MPVCTVRILLHQRKDALQTLGILGLLRPHKGEALPRYGQEHPAGLYAGIAGEPLSVEVDVRPVLTARYIPGVIVRGKQVPDGCVCVRVRACACV